ncbi:hypothetical protein BDW74DRAFT_180223 [Aspergillus multicolor]|uniref:uncharacterized protein n=1 Tax=Aspergillus multicolor TaxID=41759 RepID=UPI003CCCD778
MAKDSAASLKRHRTTTPVLSRPPAGLELLPIEILHMVLGYLDIDYTGKLPPGPPDTYFRGDQQKSDQPSWYSLKLQPLLRFCLISKCMYNVIQPLLYQEFMLGYGDSWRSDQYTWGGRLVSYIRTVALRRDLAALVKRICIHPFLLQGFYEGKKISRQHVFWGSEFMQCLAEPALFSENEVQDAYRQLTAALKTQRIMERLSAADLVTVLITLLPNLQHCSIQVDTVHNEIVRAGGFRMAGVSSLPIKTLDLTHSAAGNSRVRLFDLGRRAGAFLAVCPGLETLNLHMCGWVSQIPPLPNLKILSLTFSQLTAKDLERLLSCCTGLRSFTFEGDWRIFGYWFEAHSSGIDNFLPSDAVRSLRRHKETLESVHLDLRNREPRRPIYNSPEGPFNFRDFPVLQHLFINGDEFRPQYWEGIEDDQILLTQALPSSLVSLHLAGFYGSDTRLENAVLGLAEAVLNGRFLNLKEINWDSDAKLGPDSMVMDKLAATGVSFGYESWPLTKSTLGYGDYNERSMVPTMCGYSEEIALIQPLPDEDDEDL